MKKLLALLLLSPLAYSESEPKELIYLLDRYVDGKAIAVYCINGYVFAKYANTALVQIMMLTNVDAGTVPMKCSHYKLKLKATG